MAERPKLETLQDPDLQRQISHYQKIHDAVANGTKKFLSTTKGLSQRAVERVLFTSDMSTQFIEGAALMAASSIASAAGADVMVSNALAAAGFARVGQAGVEIMGLNQVAVGEHLAVHPGHNHTFKTVKLSDGFEVKPGQKVGVLEFYRNFQPLTEDEKLVSYTKKVYKGVRHDLEELARLCRENDPSVASFDTFVGYSRFMGPLAEKYGFDVFPIKNPIERKLHYAGAIQHERAVAGQNKDRSKLVANKRMPQRGYISREKLIELFGSKDNTEPKILEQITK